MVAEGVEDEETMERLIGYGCDQAQGYHFSRAVPSEQLLAWLEQSPYGCTRDATARPPVVSLVVGRPIAGAEPLSVDQRR